MPAELVATRFLQPDPVVQSRVDVAELTAYYQRLTREVEEHFAGQEEGDGKGAVTSLPVLVTLAREKANLDGKHLDGRLITLVRPFPFCSGGDVIPVFLDNEGNVTARRVVIEPVLGCAARGVEPPCPACAVGDTGGCERVAFGHLKAGLQTGYCADTGGGARRPTRTHLYLLLCPARPTGYHCNRRGFLVG